MRWLAQIAFLMKTLFLKKKLDEQLSEEVRTHVEMATEANIAAGMSPEEARYAALREFGNVTGIQEQTRDERGWVWFEQFLQDLRYGARQLRRSPGFTAVVVLSLGLGIGANTAIFSLVDEVLLKTLPVHKPEELVLFRWAEPAQGWTGAVNGSWEKDPVTQAVTCTSFSRQAFDSFLHDNRSLAGLFAFAPFHSPTVIVDGQAEISNGGQFVSGGYYPGLGVSALVGRLILPEDDHVGAAPVVVISYRYWQGRFGGDPAVLGKAIQVNGTPVRIIGVAPREFHGTLDVGETPDLSLPLALWSTVDPFAKVAAQDNSPVWWLRVMGRLNPDATREQVRASLNGLFQQLAVADLAATPSRNGGGTIAHEAQLPRLQITSGSQGLTEDRNAYAQRLAVLMTLVGLVLLIACLNVANLLLARGVARQREIAARMALGATRRRLVRQLLTESGMLTFLGAALGAVLASWAVHGLSVVSLLGARASSALELHPGIDARVLGFTAAIAMGTGLLFGLVPALRATRLDLRGGFLGGAQLSGKGSRSLLAQTLMVTQVGLSLVLLIGAGLFVRTLRNLEGVDVGFNREHLLLFRLDATPAGYDDARASDLFERIVQQIDLLRGVRQASFSFMPLLSLAGWNTLLEIPGTPVDQAHPTLAMVNAVDPAFFSTLGTHLLLGREFTERDRRKVARVAIVNETLARQYFGDQSAVGRRFQRNTREGKVETEIVGVMSDAKYNEVKSKTPAVLYLPFRQGEMTGEANFVVRTVGDPEALTGAIRSIIRGIDPKLPLAEVRTLDAQVESLFASERLLARISSFFGLLAMALVCVGLYGLLSYSVTRRTREIGIRMALGALPHRVLWMVLRESLILTGWGLIAGLAAALALTRMVASLLYDVKATDPLTYAAVSLLLVGAAILAVWLPARRAAKVDPVVALRAE